MYSGGENKSKIFKYMESLVARLVAIQLDFSEKLNIKNSSIEKLKFRIDIPLTTNGNQVSGIKKHLTKGGVDAGVVDVEESRIKYTLVKAVNEVIGIGNILSNLLTQEFGMPTLLKMFSDRLDGRPDPASIGAILDNGSVSEDISGLSFKLTTEDIESFYLSVNSSQGGGSNKIRTKNKKTRKKTRKKNKKTRKKTYFSP